MSHCSGLISPSAKRVGWEDSASPVFQMGQPTASVQEKKVWKHVSSAQRNHRGKMSNRHTLAGRERAVSKPEMTRMHHRVVAASMELCTPATTKGHSVWEGNTPTMSIWKSRWGVYSLWAKGHSDYPHPHAHFTEKIGYTAALKNKYFQRCPQREGMKTLEDICKCDCSAWIYQEGI